MDDYLDAKGFVGHKWIGGKQPLEFGDGALRLGQYYGPRYLLAKSAVERDALKDRFVLNVAALLTGPEPVRYPQPSEWWGQPGTMSRDNLYGIIDGCSILGCPVWSMYLWRVLKKRWMFTWNTKAIWSTKVKLIPIPDWCGPDTWRRLNPSWPYWKRLLCDVYTLISLPIRILTLKVDPDHTSPELIFVMGILNRRTSPTFVSRLVEEIYLKFQKWVPAVQSYFQGDQHPPIDEYLVRATEKW